MEDAILTEVLMRERQEKMAQWELMATAIGSLMGHNTDAVKATLGPLSKALQQEVFQEGYSLENIRKALQKRLEDVREKQGLLGRLDAMGDG